ncbi:M24 family metallopeptidase [Candidatus Woesearchaeota archaeon]|nr:M24 family metallopeptidase [Candidatus Woesearchaeota archaeon]
MDFDILYEAIEITCNRFNEMLNNFPKFKTEKEVKTFLENGLETCFDTIVASGKDASEPHYSGNKTLENGFCVIDFGIKHKGICTDITRTIYIGEPSKEEVNLYNYLLQEHNRMIKQCKMGVNPTYIEKAFRKRLGDKNKLFIHRLSHGIGEKVHQALPSKLKEDSYITIEPGLYEKDKYGIRIEDDIIIKDGKRIVLTKDVSKKLKINYSHQQA